MIAILCTIGKELEDYAAKVSSEDILYALALDGVGSAATEALANSACAEIEMNAKESGQESTIPLSPGMEGWSVEVGQPEIFALWSEDELVINLTSSGMMLPRKSLSMVLGIGERVFLIPLGVRHLSMGHRNLRRIYG